MAVCYPGRVDSGKIRMGTQISGYLTIWIHSLGAAGAARAGRAGAGVSGYVPAFAGLGEWV